MKNIFKILLAVLSMTVIFSVVQAKDGNDIVPTTGAGNDVVADGAGGDG